MFLAEPPPSQADVHFRLFGFPVRIHPFFWLTAALLGMNRGGKGTPPGELLAWMAVVLVSILVHELGHAFLQRRFGGRPWITLHGIGGLASCDDCDRSPRSQILISLAGPAAGFALALVVVALLKLLGRGVGWGDANAATPGMWMIPLLGRTFYWESFAAEFANRLLPNILIVNVYWGLLNLLPVYPLDGGQVAREVFTLSQPRRGIILSLQLSIGTAALAAAAALIVWQMFFTTLMFGYLAFENYRALQAYRANSW